MKIYSDKGIEIFFRERVAKSMKKNMIENEEIEVFLNNLLVSFSRNNKENNVIYVRKEAPIGLEVIKLLSEKKCSRFEKEYILYKIRKLSERLIFSLGFFPKSFNPNGKRVVGFKYYLDMGHVLTTFFSEFTNDKIWYQVSMNYLSVILLINGVRKKIDESQRKLLH